jgi:hypothetical protein
MSYLDRTGILEGLCWVALWAVAPSLTTPSLVGAFQIRGPIDGKRHRPALCGSGFVTALGAVPVLDEWRVTQDGRVEGRVANHPDADFEDGAIISTSALLEPKRLSGTSRNVVVKTSSGSHYQLLNPMIPDAPTNPLDDNIPSTASTSSGKIPAKDAAGGGDDKIMMSETKRLMMKVKEAGVAGIISYAFWELGFWTVSVPVCIVAYRQVTGHWPDFSSQDDLQKLGAEAFAFVNVARFAVPLRIGLALGTTPWVQKNIVDRFTST